MEWIQKARQKSDGTKQKIAIIFAAVVTLIVVGFWFLLVKNKNTDDVAKTESAREDLKPLFMIFRGAKEEFKEIKTDIKTQKAEMKQVKETQSVTQ